MKEASGSGSTNPQYITREHFKKLADYVILMVQEHNALEARVEALEAARQHLEGEQAILDRVPNVE